MYYQWITVEYFGGNVPGGDTAKAADHRIYFGLGFPEEVFGTALF